MGKVYVVCLVKRFYANPDSDQAAGWQCETLVVDPWELAYHTQSQNVFDYILE